MDARQVVLHDIETDSGMRIQPARSLSGQAFFDFREADPDLKIE